MTNSIKYMEIITKNFNIIREMSIRNLNNYLIHHLNLIKCQMNRLYI